MDQPTIGEPRRADGPASSAQECRLCGGPTNVQFEKLVLNKHQVGYHRCNDCRSLQSDLPHWLSETYSDPRPIRDTGIAARTIRFARWTSFLGRILGLGKDDICIDWGGGNGLFCRMMRDRGMNFLNHDRYVEPFYSVGFTTDKATDLTAVTFITAFEVFEHLPDPKVDLDQLFACDPDAILFSTLLYRDQGEDWFYIANEFGAHVFFYSRQGLRDIGARYGYRFIEGVEMHLFIKREPRRLRSNRLTRALTKRLLGKGFSRRLAPVFYDAWRERRSHRFYREDRRKVEEHLLELRSR